MKNQAFNPYLPSWEYIPDGEPYVFDGRVYVYGSHDRYQGHTFCLNDYVCWSAPADDLSDWRYEGVIYRKDQDSVNDGKMVLYAPDVTKGPDGRYYLFYVLDRVGIVSVAVCDTPAGKYEFLGYVHYADGTRLGDRPGDEPQFDPGVLTEGDKTYLYTGFCGQGDAGRHGAQCVTLAADMLTIVEETVFVVPGSMYSKGTEWEGHAYFEAASIRKIGNTYYFIYSSEVMHELCYAVSDNPRGGFKYGGVLVSNCDIGIDSYKPAELPMAYGANNHGSMECINGEWYIFYHRHTNGTWFCRQGCAEKLTVLPDGRIPQVPITSCGLNGGPLKGEGEYSTHLACHMFTDKPSMYVGGEEYPKIIMDGKDGDEITGYATQIRNSATLGFKSFDIKGLKAIAVYVHGYLDGVFKVKTSYNGEPICEIKVGSGNIWERFEAAVNIPDGVYDLYFTYEGTGMVGFRSFELIV